MRAAAVPCHARRLCDSGAPLLQRCARAQQALYTQKTPQALASYRWEMALQMRHAHTGVAGNGGHIHAIRSRGHQPVSQRRQPYVLARTGARQRHSPFLRAVNFYAGQGFQHDAHAPALVP